MKSKNQIKRILIISPYFAPNAIVGAKRFIFLSRILYKKYSEVHVLTLKEKYISPKDHSLNIRGIIHRTEMFPAYPIKKNNIFKKIFNRLWVDYLCILDPFSGWMLPALFKGFKIIKNDRINIIIATGPPFSPMVIGLILKLRTGSKLILDYRDPWTNRERTVCKIYGKPINRLFERLSITHASALVFASQRMKEDFLNGIGKYTKATCHVIPNGFHNKDGIRPIALGKARKNMIYAGTFYGERRINLLAKPLLQLLNQGSITKNNFCLHIFGELKNEDKKLIKRYGLEDIIKEHQVVPYEQLIKYLKSADILCLLSGSDVKYAIPFKFYDYLSVQRPILAVAHRDSAVALIMNNIDCGRLAWINNEESILKALHKMLLDKEQYTYSGAEQFIWERIGQKYIDVIEKVGTPNLYDRLNF